MRLKVSTVDHSGGKAWEEVTFGTLMWVRAADGAEESVPASALALLRLPLVEETDFVRFTDYTSYFLPFIGRNSKKNKLNWQRKHESLSRRVYNSRDQLSRERKNPSAEKDVLPRDRIMSLRPSYVSQGGPNLLRS